MMVHQLKLHKRFMLAVWNGEKQFEIRKNDRDYQLGDEIVFRVVDDKDDYMPSLLDNKRYKITHVLSGWGLETGYVALGIREIDKDETEVTS